jgi:hypothetical protein
MFLLNLSIGAEDPRCPISGLEEAASKAAKAYEESGCAEKFMVACILLSLPTFFYITFTNLES